MKKLVLLLLPFIIGIFSTQLYAQTVTNKFPDDGNVGIGTTNPTYKLHIHNDVSGIYNAYIYAGGGYGLRIKANNYNIQIQDPQSRTRGYLRNGYFQMYNTSSTETIRLSDSGNSFFIGGNVGIGTTNPSSELDISGSIKLDGGIQGLSIASLTGIETGYGEFINYGGIAINGNTGTNRQMFMFSDGSIGHNIFTIASSVNSGANWYSRFAVKQDGKVGIGTNTPDYKLSVNGTIGAKEVKVTSSGWPDFVFESDYILPTLQEVETYINQSGHLPDIPSAKEVEENGISLGEMDARLLQKIEELTLYVIELKKSDDLKYKLIQDLVKENEEMREILEAYGIKTTKIKL